jgi:methyl-accepting chemotaxis protein
MTVGKKIAMLPVTAVIAIVLLSLVMLRDIGSVFDAASYGTVNTVPSLLVLDAMESKMATIRINLWQQVAHRDAAEMAGNEQTIGEARKAIEKSLKDYEALLSDDKDKALLQADRDSLAAYYPMMDAVPNGEETGRHRSDGGATSDRTEDRRECPGASRIQ